MPGSCRAPGLAGDVVPAVHAVDLARARRRGATSSAGRTSGWTRTIATTIPWSTPMNTTPAVATSERTNADFRDAQVAAEDAEVHQRQRRGDDHGGEGGLGEVGEERVQEQQEQGDEAGARRCRSAGSWRRTARRPRCATRWWRSRSPGTSPAATLAAPMPIISWSGSTSSPRRAAKLVAVAMVSVSDTRVMPTAAIRSGPTSLVWVHGIVGCGYALGKRPHGGTPRRGEIERRRHDRGPDDPDEDRRNAGRQAGQHQQHDEHDRRRRPASSRRRRRARGRTARSPRRSRRRRSRSRTASGAGPR